VADRQLGDFLVLLLTLADIAALAVYGLVSVWLIGSMRPGVDNTMTILAIAGAVSCIVCPIVAVRMRRAAVPTALPLLVAALPLLLPVVALTIGIAIALVEMP